MTPEQKAQLRELPSVDDLLSDPEVAEWVQSSSRVLVVEALRDGLAEVREQILDDETGGAEGRAAVLEVAEDLLARRTL
ncbi:MAG: hypothetical protein GY842_10315, partial [bacterium]|nr:hypothetical protein [bacterium]